MQHGYDALMANHAWPLIILPLAWTTIGCKWVFRIKENMNDTTNKYKAHLVANGFHQKFGCDYLETFSPIVKSINIWFFSP